jgi:hypothetical protein
MANVVRGERTFTHKGEDYTMVLDMNAFTEACQVLDVGLQSFMNSLAQQDPRPHVIRALFYGAMHKHNRIPIDDCMDFIMEYGLPEIAIELKELAASVMPKVKPEAEGNAPTTPNRKERRSGQSNKATRGGQKKP